MGSFCAGGVVLWFRGRVGTEGTEDTEHTEDTEDAEDAEDAEDTERGVEVSGSAVGSFCAGGVWGDVAAVRADRAASAWARWRAWASGP